MGGETWRKRRKLDAEERRLWDRVAATTDPLRAAAKAGMPVPRGPATPAPGADPPRGNSGAALPGGDAEPGPDAFPRHQALAPGKAAAGKAPPARVVLAAPDAAPVGRPEPGLDRRTAHRLRKGGRQPDARIDLHGMTAERAHGACLRFLAEAARRGDRVVLVITGKGGRGMDEWGRPRGVLRDALPGWLRASPLGHSIVGIYQAHRRHGGEGAFYVYLKKPR